MFRDGLFFMTTLIDVINIDDLPKRCSQFPRCYYLQPAWSEWYATYWLTCILSQLYADLFFTWLILNLMYSVLDLFWVRDKRSKNTKPVKAISVHFQYDKFNQSSVDQFCQPRSLKLLVNNLNSPRKPHGKTLASLSKALVERLTQLCKYLNVDKNITVRLL